jgi:predicted nucleic acid-binding protein
MTSTYLCDVNVWLALAIEPHVHHRASAAWFDSVDDASTLVFCRATQQSLRRLLTTLSGSRRT